MRGDGQNKARNNAVVKLPDDPSPVPAGISARAVISPGVF